MRVARLELANVRAVEAAEFRFRPGFNLVVGVNGVGKTTVLDALAVCLSDVVRRVNALKSRAVRFEVGDIRVGTSALDVACDIENGEENERHGYALHKPRESAAPRAKQAGMPREQVHDTPEKAGFIGEAPRTSTGDEPEGRPLAVLFSTTRAVPSERAPAKGATAGGINAAFSGALSNRELRLGEIAAWIRVQEALKPERPAAGHVLDAMEDAVRRFLPGFQNLRVDGEGASGGSLLIDRDATTLSVRLLSNGERGVLAMALDLTRRLAQANPEMKDPAAEAEAIVLIDEIELHLHPAWQRRIVANLTRTFPKCQFIATTHSPQVVGEVEQDRIQIMAEGEVHSPAHSFGVDSSRVLEEIMGAPPRTEKVKELLSKISGTIGNDRYDDARKLLAELSSHLGENDPEVTRILTLLDFMTSDA